MASNNTTSSLWPCLKSFTFIKWNVPCSLCRISGIFILFIALICFAFNVRFLLFRKCHNSLVISLFLASLLVTVISVPGVLVQLFTCHRHCLDVYCRIEGFASYFSGCLCMLVFMILSIHRYLSLCSYNAVPSYRFSNGLCWLVSLAFTFPLVFGYLNSYMPEGLGFHCSVNWQDDSNISRLYILLSFILMYLLPLAIIIYVNFRAHMIIRSLYTKHCLAIPAAKFNDTRGPMTINRSSSHTQQFHGTNYSVQTAHARKRFRTDYRFLRAIIFLVGTYLLAWTPYSIVAVLQLLRVTFIFEHAFLITLSAFVAKISVILTPFVYLSIMNYKHFEELVLK